MIIARGPLPVSSVLDYSLQIASALEAAHASGIVHRDLKPANVIVTGAGLMAKDLFRAVDYLETRSDIDMQKLGYYSLGMGAYFAPIPLALDSRIKAAVIASGGLRFTSPPEIQPANFAPDVQVPVLLISGENDFQAPPVVQERLVELLGTPAEHKKWVVLEGGHVPNDYRGLVREALDWYDKYLGPVQ